MDTITHDRTNIINRATLRGQPIINYQGGFSSSNSYVTGDVVLLQQILYLTITDTGSSPTPIGNPNFIPYDFNTGILFTTNTSFLLTPGIYDIVMQGGGGGGGTPNSINAAGGGGAAGYIGKFVFQEPTNLASTGFTTVIGAGGGSDAAGGNTRVDYVNVMSPTFVSSLYAIGGNPGSQSGNGGNGGYGGGGGQSITGSAGGNSQVNISLGQNGTSSLNGLGSLSDAEFNPVVYTGLKGGTGGGNGSGSGGYFTGLVPVTGTDALPNSGSGGGGGGSSAGQFSSGGMGGSGWILPRET